MAQPPFRVQSILDNPKAFPHHNSVKALWNTKWRGPCTRGVYPFTDANVEDFDPIFQDLENRSNGSTRILSDPDAWAEPFLSTGSVLFQQAGKAEAEGDTAKAKDLFLRASAVYRIGRFPIIRPDSKNNREAWARGKEAYLRGSKYFNNPVREVNIPFTHADSENGDSNADIPAYLRYPSGRAPANGWPTLLFICGLDAVRTDQTPSMDMHTAAGFAVLMVELPGTGDCPAAPRDPESPDRLFTSILDWIDSSKNRLNLDGRAVVRGISTGGYYAIRLAHTHASRLVAAVGQGAWSHYTLTPEWLRAMSHGEYPFNGSDVFAYKLGYKSVEECLADNPQAKFSLLDNGILDRPCCRLLLVNGMDDSVFPIEDSLLVACHGRVKDVRFVANSGHMGRPDGPDVVIDWIAQVVSQRDNIEKTWESQQLRG